MERGKVFTARHRARRGGSSLLLHFRWWSLSASFTMHLRINPFCFSRGTKIVTFRHTVKKTNLPLPRAHRCDLYEKQQVRSHRECSFHRRRLNRRFFAAVVVARAKPLGSDPFLSSVLRGDAVRGISEFSLSLSLSRPNRTNERIERTNAQKREKESSLSLTSSSLASRIFLLSSSDPETKKHLLFFFFLSTHRLKGLSRGGGRCRR